MCASQWGQSQGESVVHLQLIHAFLPLCSKGAASRSTRLRDCVCACVNRTHLCLIIHCTIFHSHVFVCCTMNVCD